MAEYQDREHFIPLRKSELVGLLADEALLPPGKRQDFLQFCTLVEATYHFRYHESLERLKNAYAPFDPDSDCKPLKQLGPQEKQAQLDNLFREFDWLMQRANFQKLSQEAIDAALNEASDWGINMDIDPKVFERYALYWRGDTLGKRLKKRWFRAPVEKELPVYQRLVLIMKLRQHKRLGENVDTNSVYLRVYKDIPKADLEMVLPGGKIQMRLWDVANIWMPLLSGLGLVGYKLLVPIGLGVLLGALLLRQEELDTVQKTLFAIGNVMLLVGIFSYGFKSYSGYLNTKNRYMLKLSESLYYQTLDANAGVLFRTLDEAEEQECREAILAYYFLWLQAGPDGWTPEQLDDHVEGYLERRTGVKVDFEIGDALGKLEDLRLVERADGRYRAQPLEKALEQLDWTWDNYFKYNNPDAEEPPVPAVFGKDEG
jgi:hypothetical protein